ncbi:MAG: sigma-70 family RNA polymerase sigma factor [Planctomycetota bacterium]
MDEVTFARECEQRRSGLYAYALTCCRDPHLAEDIVQETLLIATRKRAMYVQESDFGLWLVSIARNVWFREREKAGTKRRRMVPQSVEELALELVEVPTDSWDRETKALRRCVEKLGDEDRTLLQRHFTDDEGYDEVATAMRRTLAWVKVRMHRLRKSLLGCVQRQLDGADHV